MKRELFEFLTDFVVAQHFNFSEGAWLSASTLNGIKEHEPQLKRTLSMVAWLLSNSSTYGHSKQLKSIASSLSPDIDFNNATDIDREIKASQLDIVKFNNYTKDLIRIYHANLRTS